MKADKSHSGARAPETAMVPVSGNGADADPVSVDKIRDLLFGNQMQDYDRRFAKLEERFLQRFKEIESETAQNLGAFESNSKKQVDSLAGQLRDEKDQRADGDNAARPEPGAGKAPPRIVGSAQPARSRHVGSVDARDAGAA